MTDQEFIATTSHPTPRWAGQHLFRVRETTATDGRRAFYATAAEFGCSRDCDTPQTAINDLVLSNGAKLVDVTYRADYAPEPVRVKLEGRIGGWQD